MKLVLMYFSPTHSTKKIVARIGKVFFEKLLCETKPVDLTKLAVRMRACPFDKEDVLVFGAPVYAGRLSVCVSDYIKTLQGNGARAVAVSVYGNRDFDDALLETCDLLTERGFTVCAAGAFIGEHSYTSAVGTGRPDTDDLLAADAFAIAAYEKVASGIAVRKKIPGNFPYKPLPQAGPKVMPAVDLTKCVHCDTCISVCPVCNIAADLSDLGRCIGCAACVRFCPQSARSFKDEGIARVAKKLEETCSQRRSPKFFL